MKTYAIIFFVLMFFLPATTPVNYLSQASSSCVSLLDEPIDSSRNTLYSPAFRAAWTLLVNDILGEYVKTTEPVPLVKKLNEQLFKPKNTSAWVVQAGMVKDGIIEQIKQSLMQKFSETDPGLDQYRTEQDAIICYSRFISALRFTYPFETLEWNFSNSGNNSKIACFGISKFCKSPDNNEMRNQVSIFDYRNPDDFIVRLSPADPSKEIILAKIEPLSTLGETVTRVNERMSRSFPEDLSDIDELVIPKIHVSLERVHDELIHKFLANEGFEDYFFAVARHEVDFYLDESGALAKATGEIVKIKGPVSRIYALDKPFLVICREIGSGEPDLVAWIANTDPMYMIP